MGLLVQVFNILKEVLNRLFGIFDFVLGLFGVMPTKKLRLRIVILRDERGLPVLDEPAAHRAYDETARILGRAVRVELVPVGWRVVTAPHGAPTAALDVHCTDGAWQDDLGAAGDFFRSLMAKTAAGTVVGYGAPVTVFIVRSISGKAGCSLGALTDYVTVVPSGAVKARSLIAHEIAHACGLFHREDEANLLHPSSPNFEITRWQAAVIRNSRHVTYW